MTQMFKKKNRKNINKKGLNLNAITDLINNIKSTNFMKDSTDSDEFKGFPVSTSLSSQDKTPKIPQSENNNPSTNVNILTDNQDQTLLTTPFQNNDNKQQVDSRQMYNSKRVNPFLPSQSVIPQYLQSENNNTLNSEDITTDNQIQSLLSNSFPDNSNLQSFNFNQNNNLGVNSSLPFFPNENTINSLNNMNNTNYGQTQSLFPTSYQGHSNLQQRVYNNNYNIINNDILLLLILLLLTGQLQYPLYANNMSNYLIGNMVYQPSQQQSSLPYQYIPLINNGSLMNFNASNMLNIQNNGNSISNGSNNIPFLPPPLQTNGNCNIHHRTQ